MQLFYYLKNLVAFLLFELLLRIFNRRKRIKNNSVLFVQLGRLGDVILSTSIFSNSNLLNGNSKYYFLTSSYFEPLFNNYRGKIQFIYLNVRKYRWNLFYRIKFLKKVTKLNANMILNFSFSRISIDDEISIIAAGKTNKAFAFENNKRLKRLFNNSFNKYYFRLLPTKGRNYFENIGTLFNKSLGLELKTGTIIFPEVKFKQTKFDFENDFYIVAPLASKRIKEWDTNKYLELINILSRKFFLKPILIGKGKIKQMTNIVNINNLINKTSLSEAIALIKKCKFFIGNDSGLLHAAIAMGKLSFGIVGQGEWGSIYPYSKKNAYFFYEEKECRKCHWECNYKLPLCLEELKPSVVAQKIINVLNEKTYI